MNTMKYRLFILFLLLCTPGLRAQEGADSLAQQPVAATTDAVAAATPEALWDLANTAYINGDYRTATETYERILDEGLSSVKLYYNLANACFKEDRLGKAILYYHRALREAPGSNDIRYNLSVAEARTKDNIAQIPEFFLTQWLRDIRHAMSCTAWTVLSLAALAIALTALLLFLLAQRMRPRKAGFYTTLAAAVGRDERLGRGQEFARQVFHGPVRPARRYARGDFRRAGELVRDYDRRRQEGLDRAAGHRTDLKENG